MSRQQLLIREFLLKNKVRERGYGRTLPQRRAQDDLAMKAAIRPPRGTLAERTQLAGLPALRVTTPNVPADSPKTVLYLHGGAFYSGSSETHRGLAAAIADASGIQALVVDYRLAPEHVYPAAHEDALAAYRALVASGVAPSDIALAGDSAGGNLVLSTLLALRDGGEPLPAAAVLISPWLEVLDFSSESWTSRAALDPSIEATGLMRDALTYFGPVWNRDGLALLKRPMDGLPPLLIQVGDYEVLLDDSRTLAELARSAGVDVTLEVWPGLWHVFQALTAILPEARQAVLHIGNFLRQKMGLENGSV